MIAKYILYRMGSKNIENRGGRRRTRKSRKSRRKRFTKKRKYKH
jgi:hypothetical protein